MGVDFFPCDECGESICDCGDYWRCPSDECRHRLCDDCANKHNVYEDCDDDGNEVNRCPFCRFQTATDWQLLQFALKKLGMTQKKLLKEYQIQGKKRSNRK